MSTVLNRKEKRIFKAICRLLNAVYGIDVSAQKIATAIGEWADKS